MIQISYQELLDVTTLAIVCLSLVLSLGAYRTARGLAKREKPKPTQDVEIETIKGIVGDSEKLTVYALAKGVDREKAKMLLLKRLEKLTGQTWMNWSDEIDNEVT
jgi:hypothetical protein